MITDIPPGFGLLRISGEKAMPFLQGQLTCDLNIITPSKWQLAAHCNPQGRVISLFYITLSDNDYVLMLPVDMLDLTLNALKKYAVFFKVKMDIILPELEVDAAAQIQNHIEAGIPFIHPATSGKCLPQELNLDELGALNFEKGCYTGQEIIARLHYRGKVKTKLHSVSIQCPYLPSPGALIHAGTIESPIECGMLINAISRTHDTYLGLAVIDNAQQDNTLFLNNPSETITLNSGK